MDILFQFAKNLPDHSKYQVFIHLHVNHNTRKYRCLSLQSQFIRTYHVCEPIQSQEDILKKGINHSIYQLYQPCSFNNINF